MDMTRAKKKAKKKKSSEMVHPVLISFSGLDIVHASPVFSDLSSTPLQIMLNYGHLLVSL